MHRQRWPREPNKPCEQSEKWTESETSLVFVFTKKALEQENVISICLPVPTMTAKPLEFSTPQWPEGQAKTYWPGSVHPPIYPSIYLSIHPASQPTSKSKQRTPKVTLWETTFSVANLWWLFRYTCGVDGSNKERGTYQTAGRLIGVANT